MVLTTMVISSCTNNVGEGVLIERSDPRYLSAKEAQNSWSLFSGDAYYRVKMQNGKYAGSTINAVLTEGTKKNLGDKVKVVADGYSKDFLLIK